MLEYSTEFHLAIQSGSRRSASVVLPIVRDLVHPSSVIDVGCGLGSWLAVFSELGVPTIHGVDGPYVDTANLEIPRDAFTAVDLARPLALGRRFDLAMSLEVAEHLPPEAAPVFVQTLVRLAPVILFSAAIPGQGGVQHLNEQWPEYWIGLFAAHQYVPVDAIRPKIWNDERVEWWYRQNAVIFVHRDELGKHPALQSIADRTDPANISRVHPVVFAEHARQLRAHQAPDLRTVARVIKTFLRHRVRKAK